jgi:hypothetical protein
MENDLPPDVAERFKEADARLAEIEAARARKGTPSLITTLSEAKDEGYLPEMAGGATAVGAAKYFHGKARSTYYESLKAVRAAADQELKLVKKMDTTQPFQKAGVKLTDQKKTPTQKTRLLKSGNRALVPYESGAKSTLSNVRGASAPRPFVVRAGKAAVDAVREYSDDTGYLTHEVSAAKPAVPAVTSQAISDMTLKQKRELAKEMARKRMTRYAGSGYGKFAESVNDPRVTGVNTRGKGATRKGITVKASDVKAGKPVIPPKAPTGAPTVSVPAAPELNFAQKGFNKVLNFLNNPWVQRPLIGLDIATKAYNMPQRFRDEQALMAAEQAGGQEKYMPSFLRSTFGSDSAVRPYVAAGMAVPRTALNFATRFAPEMLGLYDAPENLGNMYTGIIEREQADFEKTQGRPMNEEERNALLDAVSMSGISIGG